MRQECKGSSYHISVRRNGREDLYADDPDRAYLLRRLSESAEQFGVRVCLFGLMRNPIHLVVDRPMLVLVGGLRDERRSAPRAVAALVRLARQLTLTNETALFCLLRADPFSALTLSLRQRQ